MPAHRLTRHRPSRQRGAALLTAMIIVTLVATLATAMVWQQWRAVQVESAERARAQAAWILSGALELAKLILREDQKSGRPTALTEPWATPLAESRLSTFLAVDKANADDGPEAFLSGSISDAQARYNLTNLVTLATSAAPAQINRPELQTLERLCERVGVETGVAQRIATGLLAAMTASSGAPLPPKTTAQLSWLGIDPAAIQALQPYVVLLPDPTPLNVNTASKEVLGAVINTDQASAERLVQIGQRTPFKDVPAFKAQSASPSATAASAPPNIGVHSDFFEVRGRLRLMDRVLVERSLVQRLARGQVNVLQRERIAGLDQPGS
ncbi:MAG TPA: type II secretion system minor pseudopilin GspK [Burkholderiaceae bacterium]|nr:type II secretion system minor pseudopilin GspK [Burkholderiaceae bacterium]